MPRFGSYRKRIANPYLITLFIIILSKTAMFIFYSEKIMLKDTPLEPRGKSIYHNNYSVAELLPPKRMARDDVGKRTNDFLCKKLHKTPVFNQIRIANASSTPRILCFIMTHTQATLKTKAVQKTWGRKCDKLILASNESDTKIGAVSMASNASYSGLWNKLNETLEYIWRHHRNEGYDWVFKADDDTFVIMENLKAYLASPEVTKDMHKPVIHGRRYSSPLYGNLEKREVYFANPKNADFGKRFYQKMDRKAPVLYNYGGSGYAMNFPYVEKFLEVMKGPDTLHGSPPEDQAHAVVMAFHDIWPSNTRDKTGRERFHPEDPRVMYGMSEEKHRLFNDNHQATGGLSIGAACCSEKSISFHHVKPKDMVAMDWKFYKCRGL
jgi:glycoprotein-N-acetylgalactosamine 3-beta-galactosyltransferase